MVLVPKSNVDEEDDYNRLVAPWSMLGFYRGKEVFLHGMKLPSVGFAWRSGITCEMWWWRSVGEGEGAEFFCRFSAVGVLWNVPSMVGVEKEEVLCMLDKCLRWWKKIGYGGGDFWLNKWWWGVRECNALIERHVQLLCEVLFWSWMVEMEGGMQGRNHEFIPFWVDQNLYLWIKKR